jgi:hypothetical protein
MSSIIQSLFDNPVVEQPEAQKGTSVLDSYVREKVQKPQPRKPVADSRRQPFQRREQRPPVSTPPPQMRRPVERTIDDDEYIEYNDQPRSGVVYQDGLEESEEVFVTEIVSMDGSKALYEITSTVNEVFADAWNIIKPRTNPVINALSDWIYALNSLNGDRVERIEYKDTGELLYTYRRSTAQPTVESVIDHYATAVSNINAAARRKFFSALPPHLRRKTLAKVKDAMEESEESRANDLAALISEYILTQEEDTLKQLLLKRADIEPELQDALDFILDFPNNELLENDIAVAVEPLLQYFEDNEVDIPAFELMVSEEKQKELEEDIIKKEEGELKEKTEKDKDEKEKDKTGDSVLDALVNTSDDGKSEEPEEPERTAFSSVEPGEPDPMEDYVGPVNSESEVVNLLEQNNVEYVKVNGFVIVKDGAGSTYDKVKQTLPDSTNISTPELSCADYHTVVGTKQKRRALLSQIGAHPLYDGLSDVSKVVKAALASGDFGTADSRFYKRLLDDEAWLTETFNTEEELPEFLNVLFTDKAFQSEGQAQMGLPPELSGTDLAEGSVSVAEGLPQPPPESEKPRASISVPFQLRLLPAGNDFTQPEGSIPVSIEGLRYYVQIITNND